MIINKYLELTNEDNMKLMARYPDNHFDLAIVDPPYGIDFGSFNRTNKATNGERYKANKYKNSDWDNSTPNDNYFKELKRICKNQIIWGGNYFPQLWSNGCKGFIFWYKGNPVKNFSDGELAYTSFNTTAKQFDYRYYGGLEGNSSSSKKIHPTQKPVALYTWLLQNYAKEGDKILDTHLGSASIAIAVDSVNKIEGMNLTLTACELDKQYFEESIKRVKSQTDWQPTFKPETPKAEQINLL